MSDNLPYYEDPRYWSGDLMWREGHTKVPYQDFTINTVKVDYVISKTLKGKVLDIGCAMGFLVRRLRACGVDAYGIDISQYALEHAPEEVKPYLSLVDVTQGLPFADKEFDLVLSTGVFEHFEGDALKKAIAETMRVAKRGVIAITLKGDPGAEEDPYHPTLLTCKQWQSLFSKEFEVRSDSNEEWTKVKEIHTVLVISPVLFPSGGDMRYAGIERLASYWSGELSRRGIQVALIAARGSRVPRGVELLEVPLGDFAQGEIVAYGAYRMLLSRVDLILDFTHSHLAMREFTLPALAWCWHTPSLMQPALPGYNVLALSEFQRQQLWQHQHIKARVLDCHCGTNSVPSRTSSEYLFIGRATPTKGMLEAARICRALSVPLNIVGGLGPNDEPGYLDQVKQMCVHGVEYLGEVSDSAKEWLLSNSKALIYPVNYPHRAGEAHSHKSVDALLAGCPVVAYNHGALSEVVEHGVDGFLASTEGEFKEYMMLVDTLDRAQIQRRAQERWSVENVVARALPLLREVARGATW